MLSSSYENLGAGNKVGIEPKASRRDNDIELMI